MKLFPIKNRWCVHSYYTLCPYAPDGSGRLLVSGADLETNEGEVYVLSPDGNVLECFGRGPVTPSFWHTGFWQSWSPDCRFVYFQSGSMRNPFIVRRELDTGREIRIAGDMEGLSASGEPGVSCNHGMLYAAGYGTGVYDPSASPVPFQARGQHGLSKVNFEPPACDLVLSTADILAQHPQKDRLLEADCELRKRLETDEGLTLMTYCVRWCPTGDRFLFYFGNHCVVKERGEPRIAYVFTSDRDFNDIHLAVDLSFGRRGVHWGWHPDGEHLIGYGPDPDEEGGMCLAQVRCDGSDYKKISSHKSGGHPSISPADHHLLVTDGGNGVQGEFLFIDLRTDTVIERYSPGRVFGKEEPAGRNPLRVCHHPVWRPDGKAVLVNTMPGKCATLAEFPVPELG